MEDVLVGLIVAGCTLYATWALMPQGWRRAVAARLAQGPWPAPVARRLREAAAPGNACGCSGCDRAAPASPKAAPGEQPIRFQPRSRPR